MVDVSHEKDARRDACHQLLEGVPVESRARLRAHEALDDTLLVAFGLKAPDEPGAGVRKSLVVEVDRVLGREHDPEAEGARLLHERQHRQFRGRHRRGREVAEDLVHVEEGAQRRRPGLPAHPRDQLVGDQRDDEHALGIVEMRNGNDGDPRLAFRREEEPLDVERLALEPDAESRRGEQVVDRHRELEAVLGRVEGLDVEHADLFEGRFLDRADEAREIEGVSLAPRRIDDRRQQDVLAALQGIRCDADEPEQARNGGRNAVARRDLIASLRWRREGPEYRQRQARRAAGRVDGDVDGITEAADAVAVFAPFGESVLPGLGGFRRERLWRRGLAAGLRRIDPRLELGGREARKGQHQVCDVALGVDHERRNAIERGLLEDRNAKARLAAAGHADAHGVRRQVPRVVHQGLAGERVFRGVVAAADVESAQFFEVGHAAIIRSGVPCYFSGP